MSCIYEHKDTVTASGGTTTSTTLNIRGGLLRQVLIRANTSNTVFSANLSDSSLVRRHYDFHTGELNDMEVELPVCGPYTLTLTNASADDTFSVVLAVQE